MKRDNKNILNKIFKHAFKGVFPVHRINILLVMLFISFLIHLIFYLRVNYYIKHIDNSLLTLNTKQRIPIKIKIVESNKDKKILETPLQKTKKPKNADYLGVNDHIAKKQTRVSNKIRRNRLLNAGQPTHRKKHKRKTLKEHILSSNSSDILFFPKGDKRNNYKNLLPNSNELAKIIYSGYQDYIKDKMELGDSIDINTTNYRYVGYFALMRKAIDLVWAYPYEAVRKGLTGTVDVTFTINNDGKLKDIKVLDSSGYKILDDALVNAIRQASPFSPLPDDYKKDKLVVKGAFTYELVSYAEGSH